MELHQIRYAVAVAKHRNFTRAAEEMCLSQPALSQQINKLEEELGVALFERNTRNVELTRSGRTFIEHAQNILNELELIHNAMQEQAGLLKGKFVIGAMPVIGRLKLSSLITAFQRKHPGLDIHIIEGGSCVLFEQLCASKIDAAILTPPVGQDTSMVNFYPLIVDELVMVVPATHPFAAKELIDLSEAKNEKFIFPNSTTGAAGILFHSCRAAGFEPQAACECSQVETVMSLIGDGVGVALFSSRVAALYAEPGVRIVRLKNPPDKSTVLATLKRTQQNPTVDALRAFALEWVKAIEAPNVK